jgi:hypothetical protein
LRTSKTNKSKESAVLSGSQARKFDRAFDRALSSLDLDYDPASNENSVNDASFAPPIFFDLKLGILYDSV